MMRGGPCAKPAHLWRANSSGEQLQQIPPFEDNIRIRGLSRGVDRHLALYQVELTCQANFLE